MYNIYEDENYRKELFDQFGYDPIEEELNDYFNQEN